MDKSKYPQSAFRSNKSPEANALRLCFEIRSFLLDSDSQKPRNSLSKYLDRVQHILKGDHKLSKQEDAKSKIAAVFIRDNLLIYILTNITRFELELCGDIFNIMQMSLQSNFQDYIISNISTISTLLITPISSLDLDLLCGQFLRELIQQPLIFTALLTVDTFKLLMQIACNESFEISSDACVTIRQFLDNDQAKNFINENHLEVLQGLYTLCDKGYYSKRVALTLLYSLLKNENNMNLIEAYIINEENIKYAMMLMKMDESNEVRIEAFYLFSLQAKIISSCSNRTTLPAFKIIEKNQQKIIKYLEKFQQYREDQLFQQEKSAVIELLNKHYIRHRT